jgi:DNA-binding CsgD family transcriptional regulator
MQECRLRNGEGDASSRSIIPRRNSIGFEGALHQAPPQNIPAANCTECHLLRERDEFFAKLFGLYEAAEKRLAELTVREEQVMQLVLGGHPSKNIAADLGISQRTVENHRASIMKKTETKSLPELARLSLVADWAGSDCRWGGVTAC